jgi:hypothetical protein
MKTQVIQLDPHDDGISVRDRMSWAKSPRILLVYPRRSRILERALDLRLLQRHAAALGGQLAIVAQHEEIRLAAHELDIPVYKTAAIAQRRTWKTPSSTEIPVRRAPPANLRQMHREIFPEEARWRNSLAVRLFSFSLAVLAVLALLLLFFPAATVVLVPATRTQSLTISASASPTVAGINLTGSLPVRLTYIELERSKTAPVSGSLTISNAPAVGMLSFRNLTTAVAAIPAGTVVRTIGSLPVRFATTMDAIVPAGTGKTMDVPIQAVEPGSSGNLPADSLVAIEGDLGASLAVTNPSPTNGGTDRTAPVQTAGDRTRLRAALLSQILEQCKTSIPQSIDQGDTFFPDTLEVGQVLSETYFPAEGQTGQTLSLTMNLQCQAQYVALADVNNLARLELDTNLPSGFEPVTAAMTTKESGIPVTDASGTTRWQFQAGRLLQARINPMEAAQLIRGRRPAAAAQRLSTILKLAKSPKITLTPAWWPWLPLVPFRIVVSTGV